METDSNINHLTGTEKHTETTSEMVNTDLTKEETQGTATSIATTTIDLITVITTITTATPNLFKEKE